MEDKTYRFRINPEFAKKIMHAFAPSTLKLREKTGEWYEDKYLTYKIFYVPYFKPNGQEMSEREMKLSVERKIDEFYAFRDPMIEYVYVGICVEEIDAKDLSHRKRESEEIYRCSSRGEALAKHLNII